MLQYCMRSKIIKNVFLAFCHVLSLGKEVSNKIDLVYKIRQPKSTECDLLSPPYTLVETICVINFVSI